ncbi:tyrosine--tRNA ligase [candidate division Kazan bacterium RIFCSPHIGHO2_01_FULL_44_14]|uniref:Tyrosine--tRNA ligase n=1 Tax=candidate division Kazan bacterium RIFCSPLOWO2_01_FULL_45_19 TaxID=1798538 RepID=A0A1F4NQK7_UNCK3|nr:hypothetical protein [uncultured bacterium]OGB73739.1 MAG: tyrosine--tRNA ligase [candidate division Kazan bacterium RIFCSPLOWO2_01_FULL_45_19]OGB77984.1 MAG: tyrosine--tRNA ligase [candidate division Kazan bacterium RIFCSPHIGHO2_01_FULL_44_14]
MKPSQSQLKELLTRRVDKIIGEKELRAKLGSGRKLRIKHGVDPTTPDLHLGYSVVYHKLREFQELGHTVAYVIGDFTARFGDPTGKEKTRTLRDAREVKKMSEHYIRQALTILDPKKTEIRYNGEWLDKMSAEDLIRLMGHFTYAQMIERDMFQKRMKAGLEIGFHEPIYPMLQGYDSVAIESDATVIGTDQIFNEMRGRDLQVDFGQAPQAIIAVPLLVGLDGKQKMSQSLGNDIGITEDANSQYGKIMSLPDSCIATYFEMATNISANELSAIKKLLKSTKTNPRDIKMRLAFAIASMYHGEMLAKKAEENFVRVFRTKGEPDEMESYNLKKARGLADLLVESNLASSKSDAKRLIEQRGVKVDHQVISDANFEVIPKKGTIIQVGKRKFLQLK